MMDNAFGGIGLCVAYYQDRCPYAEPYYFCSYHGLETDLLNLTACWGYELWRFSTTCTLVIESVKATSVIFLLGFGSFVCYKLYRYYRKGKKSKLLKWASEELLDSLSDIDDGSVRNIESKYFGPEEITLTTNDEVTSPVSDVDSSCSLPFDSPNDQEESEETTSDLSDFELPGMGNSLTRYEPVAFNPQCGIRFSDLSLGTTRLPPPAAARPRSKLSFICSKLGSKRRRTSGVFANLGSLISEPTSSSQLELTPLQNGAGEALADEDISISDWLDAPVRHFSDGEADVESLGSPSVCMYADSESEENNEDFYINSDCASLNANFSPGSLLGRRHLLDRVPPDGADGADQHSKDGSSEDADDVSETLKKPLVFPEDNSFLETDSEGTASSIARGKKRACLTRDQSFDSTASDVSVEVSFCEDIGVSTMATFDRLLASVDQVKQSCLNLDENIDHLKGNPFYKTETLKSPASECSDVSAGHSAIDFARKYKCRASFRGLLDTGVNHAPLSDSATTTDSSGLPNSSGQLSLQWDSSFMSNNNCVLNKNVHGQVTAERTADSGSDFGASLTSESPEPNKCLLTSPISLEWEEEFVHQSSPTSPRKQLKFEENRIVDVFSASLSERIVPGQSRECSPGDGGPSNLLKSKDQSCNNNNNNNREDKWSQWTCSESGFVDDNQAEVAPVHLRSKSPSSTTRKANRDSAFCEGLDIGFSRMQENIGEKWDLIQYSETEWRGHTTRAETIRKGYAHIPSTLNCFHLRRIRGDNYCAVRAALFQVLRLGLPFVDSFDGCTSACEKLEKWASNKYSWLKDWSFGSRLPYSNSTCMQGFKTCLASLDRLMSTSIQNNANREEILVDQFNSNPDMDVQLMEAIKLLMFIRSAELYEQSISGCDVPIFAILLFARETSETPKHFMENHLNLVGDSAGLEQVEMYLLGNTLGATLCVLRPSSFGREDYICYYPEKSEDSCPEVNLIAEDDRHYNIILT